MSKKRKKVPNYFLIAIGLVLLIAITFYLLLENKSFVLPQQTLAPSTEKSKTNTPFNLKIPSQDPISRITVNKPQVSDYKMRVERIGGTIQVIMEYRPKGQVHDFPIMTIGKWDIKDRPSAEVGFEEIMINGKHAKHYKDTEMIFIDDLPIAIKYTRQNGQVYISDSEFQSLLNSIQIN